MSRYYAEQTWDGLGHYPRPYPGKYRIPRGAGMQLKRPFRKPPLDWPTGATTTSGGRSRQKWRQPIQARYLKSRYFSGLGQAEEEEGKGMFYDIGAKLDEWTHGGWSATESYQDKLAESFGLKKPDTAIGKTKAPVAKPDCQPGFQAVGGQCVPICTTPPLTQWDVDTSTCVKPPFSFTSPLVLGGVAAAGLIGYFYMMRNRKK